MNKHFNPNLNPYFVLEEKSSYLTRGFTLIELLVVIAIIGILSAVILAALNTARAKGNDAAIKSDLNTILTQSVIYYDANSSGYGSNATSTVGTAGNACGPTTPAGLFTDPNVVAAMKGATKAASPVTLLGTASQYMACGSSSGYFQVAVPLSSVSGQSWCIDSNGKTSQIATPSATGAFSC